MLVFIQGRTPLTLGHSTLALRYYAVRTLHSSPRSCLLPCMIIYARMPWNVGEKWAVNKWIRERRIRLSYESEGKDNTVHLGMTAQEMLELIDVRLHAKIAITRHCKPCIT